MSGLVIRNVTVVDPQGSRTAVLPAHDIVVAGNRIADIRPTAPGVPVPPPGDQAGGAAEVIDGTGLVALPGLINCHAHAAMVLFRGAAEDVTIEAWFNDHIWPMESNLTPDDVYWGALLAAAEMIQSGITTVADHYFHMDRVAQAMADAGLRAHLAPTMFGHNPRQELDAAADFAATWSGAAGGRITAWLGPHAPYTCPPDFLREVGGEARRLGLGVHIHVSETVQQVLTSLQRHRRTPIGVLEDAGLLEVPLLCAHAAHATPEDVTLLASSGAGVAHCPKTFLKLAAGIAPVVAMRRHGIPVGLGTDGAASNNTLDIVEQMRLAALLQKHTQGDPRVLTVDEALALATGEGARALRQGETLGRLAPGFLADIILVRVDGVHTRPSHDLRAALVYGVRASDVDTVIVDGRVLMRGRRLLTVDIEQALREAQDRMARLAERGHGRRMHTYDVNG
ncbi:MAG: amidohydrolase [Armatimonadota bacterium]|nr:amidohydrolase [Armatimonadota bacterium]MDR7402705.1 amidohydrolase [Armatimonadota bacterium]MDR7403520.1 amidohydrolase [Armatimonadota bacterium]MDR7473292.1 amidohydrolase [Armatimonadota bacterium]MDR7506499.1 amidohydrolase [Armatimonadota bacterium]